LVVLGVASQGWIALDCANAGVTKQASATTSSNVRGK
jgi:hypothetical protein